MKKIILAGLLMTSFSSLAATQVIELYKDETCGCCQNWGDALTKAGYEVVVNNISYEELDKINQEANLPANLRSCHTAKMNGKLIVGHVPLDSLKKMDQLSADTIGIAVAGMPAGSLGMEQPSGFKQTYSVISFNNKGEQSVFNKY